MSIIAALRTSKRVWLTILLVLAWVLVLALAVHGVERAARPEAMDARDAVQYQWLAGDEGDPVATDIREAVRQSLEGYVVDVPEGASKIRFLVNFELADTRAPQALYLALREQVSEIRLNGQIVQAADPVPKLAGLLTSEPAYYLLPPRLLRVGSNQLEIDKEAVGYAVALSEFATGPADALAQTFRVRNFLLTDLALIGVGILVFTFLLCWVVNWPDDDRPRIRALMLLLGASAVSTAFLTFSPPFPMNLKVFVAIWTALNLAFAVAILGYVLHEIRVPAALVRRVHVTWLVLQGMWLLALGLVMGFADNPQWGFIKLVNASYLLVCMAGIAGMFLLANAVVRDRGRALMERSVLALCLGALVLDRWGSIADLHSPFDARLPLTLPWSPIVGALMGLAMVFALAREATEARRTVIDANRQLAERLAVREAELQASYAERTQMQKQAAVMAERARIVRDMHDGIGGKLTGLRMQADTLSGPTLALALDDSLTDLRLIVDSLDTAEDGLSDALFAFERRLRPQVQAAGMRLQVDYGHDQSQDRFGPRRTLQVLRLLQEAVTNAIRHSGGNSLLLSTRSQSDGQIEIIVEDNGHGLDAGAEPGVGTDSMRHRARALGARLDWNSSAQGTRVCLLVSTRVDDAATGTDPIV
ncbi:hypothetical protein C7S18_20915 [Ahniella affigens]|uniref:histidine kinase n=1 Tax=Ahniella affigens TaxID=2021234 RepID=A0A2P1PXA0_9GAMM|nr:ATP-binding protein [Ahniella affigens]AVP99481.1 hypothetical protein C7S18_20915 [Ahniella affigens]